MDRGIKQNIKNKNIMQRKIIIQHPELLSLSFELTELITNYMKKVDMLATVGREYGRVFNTSTGVKVLIHNTDKAVIVEKLLSGEK